MVQATVFEDRDLYEVAYSDTDVADRDGDGMPEFNDAWGTPIHFIRWPAGFVSDAQPLYRIPTNDPRSSFYGTNHQSYYNQYYDPNNTLGVIFTRYASRLTTDRQKLTKLVIDQSQHDSFDPRMADRWEPGADNAVGVPQLNDFLVPPPTRTTNWGLPERGYNLMPLIYSFGVNREGGVFIDPDALTGLDGNANPYLTATSPYVLLHDSVGGRDYQRGQAVPAADADNVHNHQIDLSVGS